MSELLELVLELILNTVDVLHYWRFSLCLLLGGIFVFLIQTRVHQPKACAALVVLTLLSSVISGVSWEIHSK